MTPRGIIATPQSTREAFDALAPDYDISESENELLLRLRHDTWRELLGLFPPGSRLLDLGCGTGIDAAFLAGEDRRVVALDVSPAMVRRARERADSAGVGTLVEARTLALEELHTLRGERFDGIYSNRGPLNCVEDLDAVAQGCAALLEPGGRLAVTVIGRICPWEILYYAARGRMRRAILRFRRGFVPVALGGQIVPTRYLTPRALYQPFSGAFELESYRGLGLFLPPTYLEPLARRHRTAAAAAARLDDRLAGLPVFRDAGDLFLMVLRRRG